MKMELTWNFYSFAAEFLPWIVDTPICSSKKVDIIEKPTNRYSLAIF